MARKGTRKPRIPEDIALEVFGASGTKGGEMDIPTNGNFVCLLEGVALLGGRREARVRPR
jgi:hypothetical protein